ncbi:MAG TPA: hypothetical protein DCX05_02260 [Prevotella sp.]|uniref:Uncharacterized protein n=1 Tax=Segatella copri TaxID=165179 RepID=A0AA92SZJ3_9BACT|nr:hypothetical protein DXC61_04330 [Segatella copri]RGW66670.1 hypothetical protein DWV60_11290 [Segatella copri]HAH90920.1 hypothetical protein [Prevotella sp.]HAW82792.1 hypothetical protein [Prevotella sp.]HBI99539.1 hypothetical protein [Prevotella sp.]
MTFGLQSDYKVNTIIWDTQRNKLKKRRIMAGKVKIFRKSLVLYLIKLYLCKVEIFVHRR